MKILLDISIEECNSHRAELSMNEKNESKVNEAKIAKAGKHASHAKLVALRASSTDHLFKGYGWPLDQFNHKNAACEVESEATSNRSSSNQISSVCELDNIDSTPED